MLNTFELLVPTGPPIGSANGWARELNDSTMMAAARLRSACIVDAVVDAVDLCAVAEGALILLAKSAPSLATLRRDPECWYHMCVPQAVSARLYISLYIFCTFSVSR